MNRHLLSSLVLTLSLFSFSASSEAWAWGTIGHRLVSETAALLVEKDPDFGPWGSLLARHRVELGLYSLLPDSAYRAQDGRDGKLEAPTHFLDLDLWLKPNLESSERDSVLNALLQPFPRYREAAQAWKPEQKNAIEELGSLPWRAEDLRQQALEALAGLEQLPSGYLKASQLDAAGKRVLDWFYRVGVMAHYTGDASVPFHASEDWNGFEHQQGGIHFYYESDCVTVLDPDLSVEVLKLAKQRFALADLRKELSLQPILLEALQEDLKLKAAIESLDRKEAVTQLAPPKTRESALRKPAEKACTAFRKSLIDRLAQGAVITAMGFKRAVPEALRRIPKMPGPPLYFAEPPLNPPYLGPRYLR